VAHFSILNFSADTNEIGRRCVPMLTEVLQNRKHTADVVDILNLPALSNGNHPEPYRALRASIAAADGVYLVATLDQCTMENAITEFPGGALAQKPCALLISDGSDRSRFAIRDLMAGIAFDQQSFCYPRVLHVTRDEFDAPAELAEQIAALVSEFTVYAAAMTLFLKITGKADAALVSQLDLPRVNHLNVLTVDLQRSLRFYKETLGVQYLYDLGPKKVVTELAGFEFFIEAVPEVRYPPGFHLGMRTTPRGVFALYDRLKTLKVNVVKGNGPWPGAHFGGDGVRTAVYFEDPDGLLIEVYSPEMAIIERSAALLAG
jgi:catechol 2,3-dioxygenase-like lactoylglutathione lyase family enzyme/NAD(P)H-dependent FMN reductase